MRRWDRSISRTTSRTGRGAREAAKSCRSQSGKRCTHHGLLGLPSDACSPGGRLATRQFLRWRVPGSTGFDTANLPRRFPVARRAALRNPNLREDLHRQRKRVGDKAIGVRVLDDRSRRFDVFLGFHSNVGTQSDFRKAPLSFRMV